MNRLKQARLTRFLTQQRVASLTGISESMVSKYETGRSDPTDEILAKFAKVFGVRVEELREPSNA